MSYQPILKKNSINSLKKPQMSEQAAVKMKKMSYVIKIPLKNWETRTKNCKQIQAPNIGSISLKVPFWLVSHYMVAALRIKQ